MHKFWKHQTEAYQYAEGQARIALFMEQRLGKCAVAIRWAKSRDAAVNLILTPYGAADDWVRELFEEEIPVNEVHDLVGASKKVRNTLMETIDEDRAHGFPSDSRYWVVLNYEAYRSSMTLRGQQWDTVIADESTIFKNPSTQITKAMTEEFVWTPNKAILSGRPNPENSLDYFCQFKFLDGTFLGFDSYYAFRGSKYRPGGYQGYEWKPRSGTVAEIKGELARRAFVLTRKQANIGPTKVMERRFVQPPPKLLRTIKEVSKLFEYKGLETNWATEQHIWLQRLAGGFDPEAKLIWDGKLKDTVQAAKDVDGQVVVWARFRAELDALQQFMKAAKVSCQVIHGGIAKADRTEIRKQFRLKKHKVQLMQIRTGRFGMDLSSADTAIYFSNSESLEDRIQSMDRIVHAGKNYPLLYLDMVTRKTIDEDIVGALQSKDLDSRMFSSRLYASVQRVFGDKARRLGPQIRVRRM